MIKLTLAPDRSFLFKAQGNELVVTEGSEELSFTKLSEGQSHILLCDHQVFEIALLRKHGDTFDVMINGFFYALTIIDEKRKTSFGASMGSLKEIKSIMPGRVTKILVKEGDTVTKDQPLLVLEAMKMENEIKAPETGTVERIATTQGATVETGTLLIKLK